METLKAELKLDQIETTKLGTEICHIKLILNGNDFKELMGTDNRTFNLSSTTISDIRLNSVGHPINELRTLTSWLDVEKDGISNRKQIRNFIREKLEANKTLRNIVSI
tara:strand:- start:572 stop:895 length:324 start_codon:yes stop_codon:yes gene_type:complete